MMPMLPMLPMLPLVSDTGFRLRCLLRPGKPVLDTEEPVSNTGTLPALIASSAAG
jgi:hypothetical protein